MNIYSLGMQNGEEKVVLAYSGGLDTPLQLNGYKRRIMILSRFV